MSIIKRIPMKTVRIQENQRSHKSLIDAKEAFLRKLTDALGKENTIAGAITRIERVPEPKRAETKDIQMTFGYFDNFVRHVNDAHRHDKNAEKIQALIEATSSELKAMREAKDEEPPSKVVRTLNIIFRNGIIKPTEPVNNPDKYHWEMQYDVSCYQTAWSQIGATGDIDIHPGLSSGEVRLSYDDGDLVSNKIKLVTVIKRQAAAAKRKQYRFERGDPAFEQRCKGVAGRIKRMLKPGRLIADANFSTRVFQDRVIQLPQHLESDVANDTDPVTYGPRRLKSMTLYIAELCDSGTTDDDDYVHMIEFVEPTIYLNPRGLQDALTDIYKGKEITLRLPVDGRVDEEEKTNGEEDVLEQTRRQGILDRKKRQAARMKKAAKLEADKLEAKARSVAAELERQRREEADSQRQAEREAKEARLRQLELEGVERERQVELDRIEREKRQAEEERLAELERIQKEQEEADKRTAKEAVERKNELKRLQRQAEIDAIKYTLPANFEGFILIAQSKKDGIDAIGPSEWFKANDTLYKKSASGKSTRASTIGAANKAGWYEKSTLDKQAADAAAAALAKEEARIAAETQQAEEEAEAGRQRLEEERRKNEAEAEAEQQRLEEERLQKETDAAIDRERIAKETAEAEAVSRQAKIDALRNDNDGMAFIRYVFTTYDTNANDEIDELELVKAYFAGNTKVKAGAGRALIDENDQDGDGTINKDEFIDWCAVSGVMDDDAWQTAARDFKERQAALASGEQKSSPGLMMLEENDAYDTLVVNNDKPYLIGEVDAILAKIGSDLNKGAWDAGNEVRELTTKISRDFAKELTGFIKDVGAEGWLKWGDILQMSRDSNVRIFYVPEDTSKEFAVAPRNRRASRSINAKAICTMEVEVNTFNDGGSFVQKSVFVLKDIATKDKGAKFLFADALRRMENANPSSKMVITQPFADGDIGERVAKFTDKWGFKSLNTERPAGRLMMLESDGEDLLPPKPGDLSAMIQTMSADWVSSDEELMDFAEASEAESMEFAASSSLDTDSDLDFAQSSERSAHPVSSDEEESSEKGKTSSGMEFAESSSAETDSDMEFAETSDKTSSGLEFAESSAVESD